MAIQSVTERDDFNAGRIKWNSNDAELDSRMITISGSQTIVGEKTFTDAPHSITPTASTELATKGYVDSIAGGVVYQKFAGSSALSDAVGSKFTVTNEVDAGEGLVEGTVQLIINGVYYLSNTDQTSSTGTVDFHISGLSVIVHDTSNGGSIDIESSDTVGVYYSLIT